MKNVGAISSKEISVIVQGPVYQNGITARCLKSLRASLPEAEIILSTWQGSDVASLQYDRLVENQDPGPIWIPNPVSGKPLINNINRQRVSTVGGLNAATRSHALKFRTDFLLQGAKFLNRFDRYQTRSPDYRLFEKRILACTVYARHPHRSGLLFHPGDFVFFGLTADMLKLWQIDAAAYRADSLTDAERQMMKEGQTGFTRLLPEQCLWVGCLAKHFPGMSLPSFGHSDAALLNISEKSIANNLVLLQPGQWPLRWMRAHSPIDVIDSLELYTHGDWYALYRKFCEPAARVPGRVFSMSKRILCPAVKKFYFGCYSAGLRRLVPWIFGPLSRLLIRWKTQ